MPPQFSDALIKRKQFLEHLHQYNYSGPNTEQGRKTWTHSSASVTYRTRFPSDKWSI